MMPSPFASAKLRTRDVQYPARGYPGPPPAPGPVDVVRGGWMGGGALPIGTNTSGMPSTGRGPADPRSTERESTQRSRVGRRARDPRHTEAGVGRAPVQLLEPVVTQR